MDATWQPAESLLAGEPADLVRVGSYRTRRAAAEHGLVVLAMGLPYWLEETDSSFGVLVEEARGPAVQREIDLYERANANWPPSPPRLEAKPVALSWFTPLLWAVAVVWIFGAQLQQGEGLLQWAALDGTAVWRQGEWWRVFTALFLHAHFLHVLGNVVIGTYVFTQVINARGVRRGWVEVAMAAALANALTAAVHLGTGTTSIGASTAVFAGIGVLTGAAVSAGWRVPAAFRWRRVVVPLSAGVVLLGMLGTGDAQTDVVAHAAGFGVGLAVALARTGARRPRGRPGVSCDSRPESRP